MPLLLKELNYNRLLNLIWCLQIIENTWFVKLILTSALISIVLVVAGIPFLQNELYYHRRIYLDKEGLFVLTC